MSAMPSALSHAAPLTTCGSHSRSRSAPLARHVTVNVNVNVSHGTGRPCAVARCAAPALLESTSAARHPPASASVSALSSSGHGRRGARVSVCVSAGLFDFLTQPNAKKVKEKREGLKSSLMEAIAPLERGVEATQADADEIELLVQELESLNPTKEPLASPLINGKWKLQYTTSQSILGKNKPKFFRPAGPIYQCIDANSLQAQNIETWPFFNQVQATLTPLSASLVDVKFDMFKIGGFISVKAPESARGQLDTTYLDEDLRISRGDKGNLFVLTMEDPTFRLSKSE